MRNVNLLLLLFSFLYSNLIASNEDFQFELDIIRKQEKISEEEETISVLTQYFENLSDDDEIIQFDTLIEISLKQASREKLGKEVDDQMRVNRLSETQRLPSEAIIEPTKPGKRLHSQVCDKPLESMKQAKLDVSDTPSILRQIAPNEGTFSHSTGRFSLKKLDDQTQHRNFLLEAINKAKRHILITSYTFRRDQELTKALQGAIIKKVGVYLYYNDSSMKEEELEDLGEMGFNLRCINIHSKILAVDNQFITIGSYNWLANDNSLNQTVIFKGEEVSNLKQNLWEYIKQYARISGENVHEWKIKKANSEFKKKSIYKFHDLITVLMTPFQHQDFFRDCFRRATHSIVIHAPFITGIPEMLSDIIPIQEIESFFRTNKILKIIYRAQDENIRQLKDFMQSNFFSYQNSMVWTPVQNLHKKSIIIDDDVVTSGSFNWFSSARDLEDDYMLMETTVVLGGESAKWLLSSN